MEFHIFEFRVIVVRNINSQLLALCGSENRLWIYVKLHRSAEVIHICSDSKNIFYWQFHLMPIKTFCCWLQHSAAVQSNYRVSIQFTSTNKCSSAGYTKIVSMPW